jgi:hypothetical protein
MSYRRKSRGQYGRSMRHTLISPASHQRFRTDWDSGLNAALERVEFLRKEGWIVNTEREALMGGQAKKLSAEFEGAGYETQVVPVAKWSGEDVVFLAYRPRPKPQAPEAPKEAATPSAPSAPPMSPNETYRREFWGGKEPDSGSVDGGIVMGADRTTMFIPHDAASTKDFFKPVVGQFNKAKSLDGLTWPGKAFVEKVLKDQKGKGKERVVFGSGADATPLGIDLVLKGLKVLGGKEPITIYGGENLPAFMVNADGDKVVIAPNLGGGTDQDKVNWTEIVT